MRPPRGTAPPPGESAALEKALRRLGDGNMDKRGLGHGVYKDGEFVGSRDSVWAHFVLAAGVTSAQVPHQLGRVPGWVKVHEIIPPKGSDIGVSVWSKDKDLWTATTVTVGVALISGATLAGVTLALEIGG